MAAACGICLETFPLLYEWECGQSSFCRSCSKTWIHNSLSTNQIPRCISGCRDHSVSIEFIKSFCEEELSKKAEYIFAENSISPSDRIFCSDCSFPYSKSTHDKKSTLSCKRCKSKTCTKCSMPWKKNHKCKEIDSETQSSITNAGYKTCMCGCIIERSDFCNKINCLCGRTFCYKCNQDYEVDADNNKVKKCDCPSYDDDIIFIMYAERLFNIITQPIINMQKHPVLENTINRLMGSFVNLVSNYKTKMSDDREKPNIVKLKHPIFACLIHLASFEIGCIPFSQTNVKSLKDIESIVVQARTSIAENSFVKQQLLNTYTELIETKRKLSELEGTSKKRRKL